MPTAMDRGSPRAHTPSSPSRHPSGSSFDAAFAPGQMIAERYRIVGLLGRGGMGEVYRADDLRLGQPVALKFLPKELAKDAALLERFHAEVRNARQVSHPHVCRVYDIGEVEGHHFLSMEYVDGEDLATLLRRIGRLPPAKAIEIARQLCAGLAAAHERGVLHRDLKPSNIMLDGHGRARITDFGLAVRGDEARGEVAGTPAYMSPEQLAGHAATTQSDIYSLGLVLYEIFTGKKAFEAASFAEWRRKHTEDAPTNPSIHTADVDVAVERTILRCLEKDPAKRPHSAAMVAAGLPGGDPLAAAIAAGETPSPEMVAAAGGEGAISLRTAWSLLAGGLAVLAAIIAIAPYSTDVGLGPWEKSPAVLRERAREIVARFGYEKNPEDSIIGIKRNYDAMRYLADHVPAPGWRKMFRETGPPILFSYRQSPRPLVGRGGDAVDGDNPPWNVSGMAGLLTDALGRMRLFRGVPPQIEPGTPPSAEFDWSAVFVEAGLDPSRFQKVESKWVPDVPFDARAEWTGSTAEWPEIPLTASAAAFRGKLVQFDLRGPWSKPERMTASLLPFGLRVTQATVAVMLPIVGVAALFFARRNLLQGRGDRKGAFRLSIFMYSAVVLDWLATAHHAGNPADWVLERAMAAAARGIFLATLLWFIYVALEPYLRRRMPELLIGWARLLEGRFRDPRVGRDILIGVLVGVAITLVVHVVNGLSTWFPFQTQTTVYTSLYRDGGLNPLSYLLVSGRDAILRSFALFAMYFVFRVVLRKPALAIAALGILIFLLNVSSENAWLEVPGAILASALGVWVVTRVGLLAMVTSAFVNLLFLSTTPSVDFSNWYAAYTLPGLLVLVGLMLYAFWISLGNQPLFGAATLED